MSRIIFFGTAAHGHVNPTLPVVKELVQRGIEVHYYNDPIFAPVLAVAGAIFHPYPPSKLSSQAIIDALQDGNIAKVSVLHLEATEDLLPALLPEVKQLAPDLVIFDSLAIWGRMAATLLSMPAAASITHFIFDLKSSGMSAGEILSMSSRALTKVFPILAARRRLIRAYGKAAFPPADPLIPVRGSTNIIYTIRELQPEVEILDDSFHFVGPSISAQSRTVVSDFTLPPSPYVYISLGTIHNTNVEFYRTCFAAFSEYPATFLLSAGNEADTSDLGAIPANFQIYKSVPQLEVLEHALAFITHGGMNSLHEGLYYGVPLVIVPHQLEQLFNARAVASTGAAIVINHINEANAVSFEELKETLTRILTQPFYRSAAQLLSDKLRKTGGYRQAADLLEQAASKAC